jgi:hypothetical protein
MTGLEIVVDPGRKYRFGFQERFWASKNCQKKKLQ